MMFPSHLSGTDLGVFAVVVVFGLIVVLLFTFDFVSIALSMLLLIFCGSGRSKLPLHH